MATFKKAVTAASGEVGFVVMVNPEPGERKSTFRACRVSDKVVEVFGPRGDVHTLSDSGEKSVYRYGCDCLDNVSSGLCVHASVAEILIGAAAE